ncbi:hypothetical protein [Natronobiforma cellulositropha]
MKKTSKRLKYHIRGSLVVVLVLAAFQYWQSALNIGELLVAAVGYIILRMIFDFVIGWYLHS